MLAPHYSFFYEPDALSANEQHQITEGTHKTNTTNHILISTVVVKTFLENVRPLGHGLENQDQGLGTEVSSPRPWC